MNDSTATYEHCIEAARIALGAGDRGAADLALRAAIRATERIPDGQLQLAAALVKLGELRQEEGDATEAEDFFRRALQVGEHALGPDDLMLVSALMSLGASMISRGAPDEAEPLLTRALTISEHNLGRDHPDLAGLLNDLSRLYLKQGAHSYAEPLLLRLHAIKRVKGDDHPEVATVLASLAAVRQALGRHEAAEQLWRRVLEIRERTLAPNHFAIATALEHLAETCAARGKLDEALKLYQRSIGMREVTLGAGHASVRTARERIADLRLQASEFGLILDSGGDPRPSVPDWRSSSTLALGSGTRPSIDVGRVGADVIRRSEAPRPSTELARTSYEVARVTTDAPVRQSYDRPQPVESRVAVAREPMSAFEPEPVTPEGLRMVNVGAAGQAPVPFVMPAYTDGAATFEDEPFDSPANESRGQRAIFLGPVAAILRKRPLVTAGAGAAAMTLMFVVALKGNSLSGTEGGRTAESITPAPTFIVPPVVDSAAARIGAANAMSDGSIGDDDETTIPVASRNRSNPVSASSSRTESRPQTTSSGSASTAAPSAPDVPLPRIADVVGRNAVNAQLDSVMRNLATSTGTVRESFTAGRPIAPMPTSSRSNDAAEAATSFQSPRLIGELPRTRYPASLRSNRMEGEVIVEFSVDTVGRPDMGTLTVVRSSHELFTAAVREVIPTMRFVPAQARGLKTRAAVQVPFKFSAERNEDGD